MKDLERKEVGIFNDQKQQGLYDSEYFKSYGHDLKRERMYKQELERVKRFIPKAGAVLDVGCGTGDFYKCDAMNEAIFKGHSLCGIEVSEYAALLAQQKGITIFPEDKVPCDYFDVVILRGVIQHLPNPLDMISKCYKWLKFDGKLIFLATPNANSIYYKIWGTLPALSAKHNFMIPGDKELSNILRNFGFTVRNIIYPYGPPYSSWKDKLFFIAKLFGAKVQFAFPGNMMEIYAEKEPE